MGAAEMGTVDVIDRDLEARRHLWTGLARLDPAGRTAFVQLMARSTDRHGLATRASSTTGTVHEAYYDLMMLAVNYGLDLYEACNRLERLLSRR